MVLPASSVFAMVPLSDDTDSTESQRKYTQLVTDLGEPVSRYLDG